MKKKVVALLLTVAMMAGILGCGSDSAPTVSNVSDESRQAESVHEEDSAAESSAMENTAEEDTSKSSKEAEAPSGVVFGSNDAAGYDGFEYLMEYELTTDTTESGNEVTYSVYIPNNERPIDYDQGSVSSNLLGVELYIDLDPVLESENYAAAENLKHKVTFDWSSIPNAYYAVSVGDVQSITDSMAVCEADYIYHRLNNVTDEYIPQYRLYCMQEMRDGVTALIEVDIRADDTTDETSKLLAELESFYGFDIGWDTSFAEDRLAKFESSDEYHDDKYNMGYMSFELQEGWDKDIDESLYTYGSIFAPNGDSTSSHVAFLIQREYVGKEDVISVLLSDTETAEAFIASQYFGEANIDGIQAADYGETFMGETLEITMELSQDGESGTAIIYMGQVDDYIYEIDYMIEGASTEEMQDGQAALDLLFNTAQFK